MSTDYRGFRGEGFPAGIDEIVAIFGEMGFAVAEGPHIEKISTTSPSSTSRPSTRRGFVTAIVRKTH